MAIPMRLKFGKNSYNTTWNEYCTKKRLVLFYHYVSIEFNSYHNHIHLLKKARSFSICFRFYLNFYYDTGILYIHILSKIPASPSWGIIKVAFRKKRDKDNKQRHTKGDSSLTALAGKEEERRGTGRHCWNKSPPSLPSSTCFLI